jgi:hypothetical protein
MMMKKNETRFLRVLKSVYNRIIVFWALSIFWYHRREAVWKLDAFPFTNLVPTM